MIILAAIAIFFLSAVCLTLIVTHQQDRTEWNRERQIWASRAAKPSALPWTWGQQLEGDTPPRESSNQQSVDPLKDDEEMQKLFAKVGTIDYGSEHTEHSVTK